MVIPDGDRRYAQQAGIPFREAYLQAARTLRLLAEWLMAEHKVDEFTFFGLSLANVAGRDAGNLRAILEVQTRALREFSVDPFFRREGIRIRVCGELERLPAGYREAARRAEEATREGTRNFNLLLGYSGRSDLLQALRRTIREKPAFRSSRRGKTPEWLLPFPRPRSCSTAAGTTTSGFARPSIASRTA